MASLRVHAQASFVQTRPTPVRWSAGTSGQQHQRPSVRVRAGADGGVIDRPLVLPQWMKDSMSKKKRPPMYKVMLHNDEVNRRDYVVSVLLKVVEGLTPFMASKIMHEAHMSGIALVVACEQERAETYAQRLRSNGLTSTLEPN